MKPIVNEFLYIMIYFIKGLCEIYNYIDYINLTLIIKNFGYILREDS